MATTTHCDVCGNEVTTGKGFDLFLYDKGKEKEILNLDLCSACAVKVKDNVFRK